MLTTAVVHVHFEILHLLAGTSRRLPVLPDAVPLPSSVNQSRSGDRAEDVRDLICPGAGRAP